MDDVTLGELKVTERLLGGLGAATVERTLLYRDEPVAVVYVEQNATDCTIAWPLVSTIDLTSLFGAFEEFISDSQLSIEWWIGDKFSNKSIPHQEITSVAQDLRSQEAQGKVPLDLAVFICDNQVLEVAFDGTNVPAPATRLAVALTSAGGDFLKLFSRFHRNKAIQMNPDLAYTAFVEPTGRGFEMLRPISVTP